MLFFLKKNYLVVILFLMMILDHILTYIGISLDIISEGNKLICWLFDLPFLYSLIVRAFLCGLTLTPFIFYAKFYKDKCRRILIFLNTFYSLIFVLHLRWIMA